MSKKHRKLVIFSGAGLSADSGIATFRDSDGLWASYDPLEVCNFKNWEKNYELVHRFYNLRREELKNVKPNAMHEFLASLVDLLARESIEVVYLTQNVDDLLERAGAQNVIHLHGELTKIICPKCHHISDIGYECFDSTTPCPKCANKKQKPKIVFFYESAPLYEVMNAVFFSLGKDDSVLVVGTSGSVIPIGVILGQSRQIGLKILNNLAPSPYIDERLFDKVIYSKAIEAIPQIKQEIEAFFGI